jgi:hypothetical protein
VVGGVNSTSFFQFSERFLKTLTTLSLSEMIHDRKFLAGTALRV